MRRFKLFVFILTAFVSAYSTYAVELVPNVDVVSRYLWRGKDFGASPAAQPGLTFGTGAFKLGAWGSVTLNDSKFQEQDLFLSYTFFDNLTVGVTDYFFPNDTIAKNGYFNYDENTTAHIFEANLKYFCGESLPLTVSANYNFYGLDKAGSGYFELGYTTKIKDNKVEFFVGAASAHSIYGEKAGLVNVGVGAYKDLVFSDKFTLPLFCRFITNPQAENIHLVVGISL